MAILSGINIFSSDIDGLAEFYAGLLGLEEIVESRSALYRGFRCGGAALGFSALDAYGMLSLRQPNGDGERNVITFDVLDRAEVRRLTDLARSSGGTVAKEPFETYYGWYQAILRDPEGNAFRLNCPTVGAAS